MPSTTQLLAASLSALVALSITACSAEEVEEGDSGEEALAKGENTDRWVYNGTLPHLENPSVVISYQAHTARITGTLPARFDASKLPFYAKQTRQVGGRTIVDIVYPVATGAQFRLPAGDYKLDRFYPRRTDSSSPWGGFPFISYVNPALSSSTGVAFHGPITSADGEWKLIRGPVSHGCNRMQGEHVVELAHLLGADMTSKVWSGDTIFKNYNFPVKVLVGEPDVWDGHKVDVAYEARAEVRRPTGDVKMFRTWRSQDFPSWVCRVPADKTSNLPADFCKSQGNRDRFDAMVGPQDAVDAPVPAGSCASASLGRTVGKNTCVQRNRPGDVDHLKWFRCVDGEWQGPSVQRDSACGEVHAAN